MNETILVVDDDYGTVKFIETILSNYDFKPVCFTSPVDALKSCDTAKYDLIISDFFMPKMDGFEFLKRIREIDKYVPFIVITCNTDVQNAINLLKHGADDYIAKPVINEELIFRINKNIEEKHNKKVLDRIEKEKEILAIESKRMVDWKNMYAGKDIKQTGEVINLFNRTFNQSGGLVWLDILKSQTEKIDGENYKISASLIDLIIESTEANKNFFDNITFISSIDNLKLNFVPLNFDTFVDKIFSYIDNDLNSVKDYYQRKFILERTPQKIAGDLNIDLFYITKVMKELVINAIKYSPKGTDVFVGIEKNTNLPGKNIDIVVKNFPKKINAKDLNGDDIVGIPYEYSELVFDLFYTIEAYPNICSEEEWGNGTGLFIARKIAKKHNGWLETVNEIDYTKGHPVPLVKFTLTLPLI
jgi:DNA-binding response OmpR family regulator